MNTFASSDYKPINWSGIIMFVLGFWLSSSLLFDCVIIPSLLSSGMMNTPDFASASYFLFGIFNHIELLCAAVVLAGYLVFRYGDIAKQGRLKPNRFAPQGTNKSVVIASILLVIALAYTYILTPQMSSMGMSLDQFASARIMPSSMTLMHIAYWSLEVLKLIAGTVLLRSCYRSSCRLVS